jgi:hypothetical protein
MLTKKQLTTMVPVQLGAVAQLNKTVYKEEADFEADCIYKASYCFAKAANLVCRNSGSTTKNIIYMVVIADQRGLALITTKYIQFTGTRPQSLLTVAMCEVLMFLTFSESRPWP